MQISNKKFMPKILLIGCALVLLFFLIILLLVVIPLYRERAAYQDIHTERVNRLQILLCKEIQLEMTKEQVISILEQKGEIRIHGNYDEPNLNLGFIYMDPALQEYYGPFDIVIDNNRYVSGSISTGFESYEIICSTGEWWKD